MISPSTYGALDHTVNDLQENSRIYRPTKFSTRIFFGSLAALIIGLGWMCFDSFLKLANINFPSAEPLRLAVCYSGQVLSLPQVYNSNLLVFRRFGASVYVYGFLDLRDDFKYSPGLHFEHTHNYSELKPIFEDQNFSKPLFFSSKRVRPPSGSRCYERAHESLQHYTYNYLEFYAAAKCFQLVRKAEKENGIKFDWVLSLRPDQIVQIQKPPDDMQPRIHMSGHAAVLVPRYLANVFFSTVKAFEDDFCAELDAMGFDPCVQFSYRDDSSECLIVRWLKRHNIKPSDDIYVRAKSVLPIYAGT